MRGTAQRKKKRGGRGNTGRAQCKRRRSARARRSKNAGCPQIDITGPILRGAATHASDDLEERSLPDNKEAAIPGVTLPLLDRRLQKRYLIMVQSHLRSAPELAAGVASLPSSAKAFAATQATWRFLNNDRVSLPVLVDPLRELGRSRLKDLKARFALLVHDWCKLSFTYGKHDLTQMTHSTDIGYELTTALMVSADDGSPLAPMEMHLKTAGAVLSTRSPAPKDIPHLDQVLPTMEASREWKLEKPFLHVIDREADSVDHFRKWDSAGFKFLVRADDRRVDWSGKSLLLTEIRKSLVLRKAFHKVTDEASYRGQAAQLWVAETNVILDRPAKKNVKGKRFQVAGRALPLRYIVVQLRDCNGKVLAEWMLLTNAPKRVRAEHLARCYYWRWRIESFFKLLKSHGQQLEQWQQETGPAIARRLLVASMACVVVWQLQADDTPQSVELKSILIRLSGRQMKRNRLHTAPALLAGLWVMLSMLALLEHYDLDELRRLSDRITFFRRT
jgi:Transposase DDE domain/Transposase DNA-binding